MMRFMNLERWLQLRREGRMAAMPLGMPTAMAACGNLREISYISHAIRKSNGFGFLDGGGLGDGYNKGIATIHGDGNGWGFMDGSGFGDGFSDGESWNKSDLPLPGIQPSLIQRDNEGNNHD